MSNRGMSGNGGNARGSADSWMVAQRHGEHQAQDKPRRPQQDAGRDWRDEVHLEEIERLHVGMDEQRRSGDQAEQGAPERAEQERGYRDGDQLHNGVGHPLVGLPQAHQAQLGERERDRGGGHRDEHHRLAPRARAMPECRPSGTRPVRPSSCHPRASPPSRRNGAACRANHGAIISSGPPTPPAAERKGSLRSWNRMRGCAGARHDAVAAAGAEATQPHHRAQRGDGGFTC